jgi:hypothetical protein
VVVGEMGIAKRAFVGELGDNVEFRREIANWILNDEEVESFS